MASLIMFCILTVAILDSAIMYVLTKRIMRAATFLMFVLFSVVGTYFLLGYTYLGAAQIAICAGGVTILYILAIWLVSERTLQGLVEHLKGSRVIQGALLLLIRLATVIGALVRNQFIHQAAQVADAEVPMSVIGQALMDSERYQCVLPFKLISVFLLACIVSGLLAVRKEDDK